MVAICDRSILGKTFSEGELRIHASESFYKGDLVSEDVTTEVLKKATIANLLGKKAVSCALKNGIITKENIITIGGVPHAQMARM